jgi:AcrR family transcriptional regulator
LMGTVNQNQRKENTKRKIIEVAIKLISTNGFNATSTALIAKEAGISEGIIFKYFRDKQSLLKEIGDQAIRQVFENISLIPMMNNVEASKELPLNEFLKSIFMERLDFIDKNFELVKILLFEMQYNDELLTVFKETLFKEVFEMADEIREIIQTKLNISSEQVLILLQLYIGALVFIFSRKYVLKMDLTRDEMEKNINNIVDFVQNFMSTDRAAS